MSYDEEKDSYRLPEDFTVPIVPPDVATVFSQVSLSHDEPVVSETPINEPETEAAAEPRREIPEASDREYTGRYETSSGNIHNAAPEPARDTAYSPAHEPQSTVWRPKNAEPVNYSAPFYSGYNYSAPQRQDYGVEEKKPKRAGRGLIVLAVIILLISPLLGAAAGIISTKLAIERGDIKLTTSSSGSNATTTNGKDLSEQLSDLLQSARDEGNKLTPQLLYVMACQQVVSISSTVSSRTGSVSYYGSGFILSSDGYIVTNEHVIADAVYYSSKIYVTLYSGEKFEASVVGYESDNDVAVLKIAATGLSAVSIGSSADIQVGETIYAVGNPRQLDYTMTDGIVSATERNISIESVGTITMFQISAAVNSGNSGGPVYNEYGEVVGIVSAKYADEGVEGLGFAIPIDDAMGIASELIEHGYISGKPMLGVTGYTVGPYVYTQGVPSSDIAGYMVISVDAGSAAEKAGIKVDDIVVKLGDTPITGSDSMVNAKKAYKAGDTTEIVVYRVVDGNGEYITLTITFDEAR